MYTYVIEEFKRNDEYVEYGSEVIAIYDNLEEAIKHTKCIENDYISHYGYRIEEEADDNIVYNVTLDTDPENEAEYADFVILTITKHKIKSKYKED